MPVSSNYKPAPSHQNLGENFFDPVEPAKFPKHILRFRNQPWAERLGLGDLTAPEWERYFARFEPLPENLKKPLALRYHGHQFRTYNPDLGDGRGFLYAQLMDPVDQRLLDFGTKGSGQTPWSRSGDGRLTLKGAMREVLATEMLEALGVYTSKTMSVFETGEALTRNDEPSPTRSAVLVRLNHSHVRFGTFQRLAAHEQVDEIKTLLRYSFKNYFPELGEIPDTELGATFLREVTKRSAWLCASWMMAGFVHGVLNTDNMNITGESFDYGPYRFMPSYDPTFTAAYFDHSGLYCYARQPESVLWSLERLGECFMPFTEKKALEDAIDIFPLEFNEASTSKFFERMGLEPLDPKKNEELFLSAFAFLAETKISFDQFFFDAYGGFERLGEKIPSSPEAEKYSHPRSQEFQKLLAEFKRSEPAFKNLHHAYFAGVKPCSLLIDEIEAFWATIDKTDDWSLFNAKVDSIREMGAAYGRTLLE